MKRIGHTNTIGRYQIDGILGHGGMGSVYRAIAPETGRLVALKVLNPSDPLAEFMDEKTLRDIFNAEVQTLSRLHHPNITEILDFAFDQGRPFYTMEFFCNNLGIMIGEKYLVEEESRRIPPEKSIDYGCQILSGLECMHTEGIVHRDIKPFNVLVTSADTIKICDFGMAKLEDEKSFAPQGINIGSPYYTAPEQLSDPEHVDSRADLYSAGVLIYRMITGELPAMKDFMLSRVNPLYDDTWDAFFARALSWRPELRFQNAREMQNDFKNLELHWENNKEKACRTYIPKTQFEKNNTLRSVPVRTSGTKARKIFEVDNLWQPSEFIDNSFEFAKNDTILDKATGLIWQRIPSDYPLDRESADDFIKALNEIRFKGIDTWRLPSVNELLSLANDPILPVSDCPEPFLQDNRNWFWSCDRRSRETSWYVNIRLAFTGWQNNNCQYTVRAVTTYIT